MTNAGHSPRYSPRTCLLRTVVTNLALDDDANGRMIVNGTMRRTFAALSLAAYLLGVPQTVTAQGSRLRDLVREQGEVRLPSIISCGPPQGLKEIVDYTELTVEGIVADANSSLTAREDDVYTDYVVDVIRIFRVASTNTRTTPGAMGRSPFLTAATTSAVAFVAPKIRVRALYHGRVALDGGSVVQFGRFEMLNVGEHVILSVYYDAVAREWMPFGVFEVRDGRVLHLEPKLQTQDYDSVEAFAAALANPPPTVQR